VVGGRQAGGVGLGAFGGFACGERVAVAWREALGGWSADVGQEALGGRSADGGRDAGRRLVECVRARE